MGQKKLQRFAAIKSFKNVLEFPDNMPGQWAAFYGNTNPITLELACGKGEYTTALAALYPQQNFLGVDIKGNRIWKGAKTALDTGLQNAAFLRTEIERIETYFEASEVSAIWITFPDPHLQKFKKRLTHPRYLRKYQRLLKPGGLINLKTDSPVLYTFTKEVINLFELNLLIDVNDVYATAHNIPELNIKTHYEGLNISGSNKIYYLQFNLPEAILPDRDIILKEIINDTGID